MLTILFLNLAAALALMVAGWLASLIRRNVTLVDSLWGMGFVIIGWLTFFLTDGYAGRQWLMMVLVTVWGLRLSIYLCRRNWGKGEDPRYGDWRKKSGDAFWHQSLFKVFILQALFLWVIALPLQFGQMSATPDHFTMMDLLGASIWVIGFAFETVADAQLSTFKADPANKGKVMDQGLWAYSRHPNYFGEALLWWGVFLIASVTPESWWTVIGPVAITAVLLKMTGIPLTERKSLETRPGYRDYIDKTSAFIPWRPRKGAK